MSLVRLLFSRRWWWSTLLVVAGVGVLVRLGIWQLDRLEQRKAANAHLLAMEAMPVLDLNQTPGVPGLLEMEYRAVQVRGTYDYAHEVLIRNQAWNGQPGFAVMTPLLIEGTDAVVMINRGWIPAETYDPVELAELLKNYRQQATAEVHGLIRASREKPDFGQRVDMPPVPGETRLVWNLANLDLISRQLPYPILPVYVQRGPEAMYPADENSWPRDLLPFPSLPSLEISEGPHLGYALQWFTFALILGAGYPVFLAREKRREQEFTQMKNHEQEE